MVGKAISSTERINGLSLSLGCFGSMASVIQQQHLSLLNNAIAGNAII
jgi:hypothetical protein